MGLKKGVKIGKGMPPSLQNQHQRIYRLFPLDDFLRFFCFDFSIFFFVGFLFFYQLKTKRGPNKTKTKKGT